jgi:Isochorismatase family
MTKDLGVWSAEDSALVLIDYQKEMFEVIRSETNADLVELHVRLLAKTARAFGMPIVLSTVGVEYGFNGPTLPSILSELDGIEPIDRSSMNAFEDSAFREAVKTTGKKRTNHRPTRRCPQGCVRGDVRGGRRRRTLADRAPHSHRAAGACRSSTDHGALGSDGTLPRLGIAARRTGARRHLLVLQRDPQAHQPGGVAEAEKLAAAAAGVH